MILLAPSINFIPVVLQKLPSKIKPMWFSSNIVDSNHKIAILIKLTLQVLSQLPLLFAAR